MKNIILCAFIALCSFLQLAAQTTETEYNYITKGYKIQIESGLDMKKGYEFKDISTDTIMQGVVSVKALHKTGYSKPTAIMIEITCIYCTSMDKKYFCVPHPNSNPMIFYSFIDSVRDYYSFSSDINAINNAKKKILPQNVRDKQAMLECLLLGLTKALAFYSQK